MLYLKITLRNIWRSKSENSIYFFTIVFCSSIFFAFQHLQNLSFFSNNREFKDLCIYLLPVFQNIKILSQFAGIPIIFLIAYIDRFLLKSRSKEYSLYFLLGIAKRNISMIMFLENFIIGILAVTIGCFFGSILSFFLKCFLVNSLGYSLKIDWFYALFVDKSIFIRIYLFFGIQFLIVGIVNTFLLSKLNFIDMMRISSKWQEQSIKKGNVQIWKAVLMIGVILYIASVYINTDHFSMLYILGAIILGLCLIFLFYHTISVYLKHNKSYMKQRWGIFVLSELMNNINTRIKTYEIITVVALFSLCAIAVCNILQKWGRTNIEAAYIFDIQLVTEYDTSSKHISLEDKKKIETFVAGKFDVTFGKMAEVYSVTIEDKNIAALKLSDFNALMRSKGYKEAQLDKSQFLIYESPFRMSKEDFEFWEKVKNKEIQIEGVNSELAGSIEGTLGNGFLLSGSGIAVILPDSKVKNNTAVMNTIVFNIKDSMPLSFNSELSKFVNSLLYKNHKIDASKINCQTSVEKQATEHLGGLTVGLLAIYLGCFFAVICSVLLMIQNLSQILVQQKRYKVLYELGVDKKDITHKIWALNFIHYYMPIVLALFMQIVIIGIWGIENIFYLKRIYSFWTYIYDAILSPITIFCFILSAYFLLTSMWSVKKVILYIEKR